MYQFTRAVRLAPGDPGQQMAWAFKITEKVNQISEVPVLLWSSVMSPQTGTLAWSATVPSLAVIEAVDEKLNADNGFLALAAEGASYGIPGSQMDRLVKTIHMAGAIDPTRIQYVLATTMFAIPGKTAGAVKFAIDTADRSAKVTGTASTVGTVLTGLQSALQLASYFGSIEELETGYDKVMSDATFMERADAEGSKVIQAGTAESTIVRRLA